MSSFLAVDSAGFTRALEFEKRRDPRFEVTVVNRENFFLFTPMLHEIAASDLDLTNIVNPIRKMIRHVNFFCGDVDKIDIDKKKSLSHMASIGIRIRSNTTIWFSRSDR